MTTQPTLSLTPFPIPNKGVFIEIMRAERATVESVRHALRSATSEGTALVDPMGKPVPHVGSADVQAVAREILDEALAAPTAAASYALTKAPDGTPTLADLDTSSIKIAYLIYQGAGTLLGQMLTASSLPPAVTRNIVNLTDYLLVTLLSSIHNQSNPMDDLHHILQFRERDPETKLPLVGETPWAEPVRTAILGTLLSFLSAGDYLVQDQSDPWPWLEQLTATGKCEGLDLNDRGQLLRLHLLAQLSLKRSLAQVGPTFYPTEGETSESRSESEIASDLATTRKEP